MSNTDLTAKLAIATSQVTSLETKREKLRAEAAADPRNVKLENLRVHRVTYKSRLLRTDLTDEETSNLRSALSANQSEADGLLAAVHAPLVEIQEKLSVARKEVKALRKVEAVEALASVSDEDLAKRRAEISTKRRQLKRELSIVVGALSQRQARAATAELVASKNPDERKALFEELSKEFAEQK